MSLLGFTYKSEKFLNKGTERKVKSIRHSEHLNWAVAPGRNISYSLHTCDQADGALAPDPPSTLPLGASVVRTDTEKVFGGVDRTHSPEIDHLRGGLAAACHN